MRSISIQVQPDLVPDLDMEMAKQLFGALEAHPLAEKYQFDEGIDNGPYLNFTYGTNDAPLLWAVIQKEIYAHSMLGERLLECSMAMCSSEQGWDNYVLVHHFDPAVPSERL